MTALIETLIPKYSPFELTGDLIAAILATETAEQQIKAAAAGEDPDHWKIRVYSENMRAWEQWIDPASEPDKTPIVNVWYDSSVFPEDRGTVVGHQQNEAVFNIDCLGYGENTSDGAGGQIVGSKEAAASSARALFLVSQILMSGYYTYLNLRGTVGKRWIRSVTKFQPTFNDGAIQNVLGSRASLYVSFVDTTPQTQGNILELISTVIKRDDGFVYAQVDSEF